jgi:hypothetical protein
MRAFAFFFTFTMTISVAHAAVAERIVRFKKQADSGEIQRRLVAAGFTVKHIDCVGMNCTIHLPASEKKDPASIIAAYTYSDLLVARKQKLDGMRGLLAKWQNGTITPVEKDDLLKQLVEFVVGS